MGTFVSVVVAFAVALPLGFALGCVWLVGRARALLYAEADNEAAREYFAECVPCDEGVM